MDYKDTLHMPKTGFEMRGNLTKKEPKYQKRWQEEQLYDKMLARAKTRSRSCCMTALHTPTETFTWDTP